MNNEMTRELLERLSPEQQEAWKRCQKATPGPWVSGVGSWNKSSWKHKAPLTCAEGTLANFLVMNTGDASVNGEFTAYARQDLPAALLELAKTKAELAEARKDSERLKRYETLDYLRSLAMQLSSADLEVLGKFAEKLRGEKDCPRCGNRLHEGACFGAAEQRWRTDRYGAAIDAAKEGK